MEYSKGFERDWKFYRANKFKFSMFGDYPPVYKYSSEGVSAKQAFYIMDSTGKVPETREPHLLSKVITCKKSINFHIKQWGEGWVDMCEPVSYYTSGLNYCPEWFGISLRKQAGIAYDKQCTKGYYRFEDEYNMGRVDASAYPHWTRLPMPTFEGR